MLATTLVFLSSGLARGQDLPADLDAVPRQAAGFIHIRAADLYQSEHLADLRNLLERAGPEALRTFARKCPVENGRMTDLNFDRYRILRLAEMPKVETAIVPSYDFWGGVGEPTISVVTPAVLNAIFAATGKPVRSLPLKDLKLV